MNVIAPISVEDVTDIPEEYHRLILFDPKPIYELIYNGIEGFSHYKRRNSLQMQVLFPDREDGTCACGCGRVLEGRRRRWYSNECTGFALKVHGIISGDTGVIRDVINGILGEESCLICGKTDNDIPRKSFNPEKEEDLSKRLKLWNREIKEMANKIHVEHIVPVHKGGGGCWLSNYQFLCEDCHKEKTKQDRL